MASSGGHEKEHDEHAPMTPKARSRPKDDRKPNQGEHSAPRSRVSVREAGVSGRTGRRHKKPSTGNGMKKDSTMRGLRPGRDGGGARSQKSEVPRAAVVFQTPKDEYPLANLEIEGQLACDTKLMEEYKIAMQQIHNTLIMMMRRGNGTTDMDNIKSEKNQSAPEKLNKEVIQTKNFWFTDKLLQPAMNDAVAKNTAWLAIVERGLQDRGPRHLLRIKKFIYHHYPKYVEMKKELSKIKKDRPDTAAQREEALKKIGTFVKEKYQNQKSSHLAELQSAFVEIGMYHHASTKFWYQISERKMAKDGDYNPEAFDYSQFFKPVPK